VTVVIPAYNLAAYLPEAIDSVLQQDYPGSIAIIILDDGSTDSTLSVARQYAQRVANLQTHTQANQGRAVTRNRLLELAETDLVAWLDGDDIASPTWLRQQVNHLVKDSDCVAVGGQGYAMTASRRPLGPITHPLDFQQIDQRHLDGQANAFFQSCVTLRKAAVEQAGGYNPQFSCAEDYDLWLRLAEIGALVNLPDVHLFYRVHATSANWTVNIEQRNQGFEILQQARRRRGLPPREAPWQEIPPASKDDWNRRLFWINIALRSGNPRSALEMIGPALKRHPASLVLHLAAIVAVLDTILFRGNRTRSFSPGRPTEIGSLPKFSCYRFGRSLNRIRRRLFA